MKIELPDGSRLELNEGATVLDAALSISRGLAKAAVLGRIGDREVDLTHKLGEGDKLEIITDKHELALDTLRHSAAHLMAAAILKCFPGAQLTIGPVTDDGFYYDIHLPEGQKLLESDFPNIESAMQDMVREGRPFERCVASREDDDIYRSYQKLDGGNNPFKREIIDGLKAGGGFSGTAGAPEVSFYRMGDFVDLCRGPHISDTSKLKHVKLMRVSGSYWRGDQSREALTRVYGTAFFKKEELDDYLKMLEEARRRDHRTLGEQLELFHFIDDAPGFPFLHPKGATIYNLLVDYMRAQLKRRNYQEVRTPIILSEQMWHKSGHYDNYLENMFFTKRKKRDSESAKGVDEDAEEDRPMAVKPMNCPGHLMIYRHKLRSHNEFPLRICEMGLVHRRELSGVRHGLFRVQAFVQDDAHHFCTPEQIEGEINLLIDFFHEVYGAFGLGDVHLELSTRPGKSIGSDEMWQRAESSLKTALEAGGRTYKLNPGDGAFYGPKIDFHIRDAIGRTWQCGTIQLDFSMPQRFGLEYVGADGARHTPVMIHRACYGSLERFFGIIIEHYAGAFPLWLSPVQVVVLPVSEKYEAYADKVCAELVGRGMRAECNRRSERLGYRIREATMTKIPYIFVLGEKEEAVGGINVRSRDRGELGAMTLGQFFEGLEAWNIPAVIQQAVKI